MNDDELRLLIRAAIQRHIGLPGESAPARALQTDSPSFTAASISFRQYRLERTDGGTECLIEPAVQCNHCGFCKCHGH